MLKAPKNTQPESVLPERKKQHFRRTDWKLNLF